MIFVFLIVFGREMGNYLMNASWDKGNFFAIILVFLCAVSFSVVLFFLMFILWGGANVQLHQHGRSPDHGDVQLGKTAEKLISGKAQQRDNAAQQAAQQNGDERHHDGRSCAAQEILVVLGEDLDHVHGAPRKQFRAGIRFPGRRPCRAFNFLTGSWYNTVG